MNKQQALKQYFGYDTFRPLQEKIIDTLLQNQDCLAIMPTGSGKSLCFQIPALLKNGLAIVLSPLIALMKDQVQALRANGIEAAFLNSSQHPFEQEEVFNKCRNGELRLLYISPEKLMAHSLLDFFKTLPISLFAIDESHCISSWGHDFRPEYRQLGILKREFPKTPLIALTATADRITRLDILKQLGIENAPTFLASFDRPNLSLTVASGRERFERIQDFLAQRPFQAGIIYCLSRKSTEDIAEKLQKKGYKAAFYHAKMDAAQRSKVQDDFMNDKTQIIVATIAFGMGIDKSNIRWVIHYNLPSNVESFYQEIGRAGRDSMPSDTLLFFTYQDILTRQDMIASSEMPEEQKQLLSAKLDRMKQYATAEICRRRVLLSYFNENFAKDCQNCDVCQNPPKRFDGTILAQKALSAIARSKEKVAMGMLIDILRGSKNQDLIKYNYHTLPTFGVGKDLPIAHWQEYVTQMLNLGLMDIAYDQAHALKLNEFSWKVLRNQEEIKLVHFRSFEQKKQEQPKSTATFASAQPELSAQLFEALRKTRSIVAEQRSLPPYMVFSDATLTEMSVKCPLNEIEMKNISGVGQEKYRQFGLIFSREIEIFLEKNPSLRPKNLEQKSPTLPKNTKISTYEQSLELYRKGLSILQIAKERQLAESTIAGHLIKLSAEHSDIRLRDLIQEADFQEIKEVLEKLALKRGDALKPIFDYFGEKYTYTQVRIAFEIWAE